MDLDRDGISRPDDGDNDVGIATWHEDRDGNGFGDAFGEATCVGASDAVADDSDCNDASVIAFPGADEYCNAADDDCDGEVDEGALDPSEWCADADHDGFGDPASAVIACEPPAGGVANCLDCDDNDAAIGGGDVEYADADADGYGSPTEYVTTCEPLSG